MDDAERAAEYQAWLNADCLDRHMRSQKAEKATKQCTECGEKLSATRRKTGAHTCIDCQEEVEKRGKHYAKR